MDNKLVQFKNPTTSQDANVGGYEGASHIDRETALWQPALRSADSELLLSKDTIDARSNDLHRNDGYIHGVMQHRKDSIVGAFFRLNAKPDYKYLGLSPEWAEEFQEVVESAFTLAAESERCWFDASEQLTFAEIIRLALGVTMMAGETVGSVEWIRDSNRPFSTAIQLIDPIRLSNPEDRTYDQSWRKGVLLDRYRRPVRYAFREVMGDEIWGLESSYRWKIVDAKKPWGRKQVIHRFEPLRVDQTRGVAELVTVLKESKMTKKYSDIVLQNAVLNATFAAAIESDLPTPEAMASIGADNTSITEYATNYLQAIAAYTGEAKNLHVDGVRIPHLYPGTKLTLQNAGQPGGLGTGFEASLLRGIAAGLGLSYEELSKDFTKTNYSSARAAMGETWKRLQAHKRVIADRMASEIYRLWFEEMLNAGEFNSVLPRNAPNFYERMNADAYCACGWIGAPRGQIDEYKETQAAMMRINGGLSTYEKECARFGEDYRVVFRQRQREQNLAQELGLNFAAKESTQQDQGGNDDQSND